MKSADVMEIWGVRWKGRDGKIVPALNRGPLKMHGFRTFVSGNSQAQSAGSPQRLEFQTQSAQNMVCTMVMITCSTGILYYKQ